MTGYRLIRDFGTEGMSIITIRNNAGFDAVVTLVSEETMTAQRAVYIDARDTFTIENLAPARYLLRWTSGGDWVSTCMSFLHSASYSQSGVTLVLREDYETATRVSATLEPVVDGNVPRRAIDRAAFLAGLRNAAQ